MRRVTYALTLASSILLSVQATLSQEPPKPALRRNITIDLLEQSLSPSPAAPVTLHLGTIPTGKKWVVGVRAEPTAGVKFQAGVVFTDTFQGAPVVKSVAPFSAALLAIRDNTIRLEGTDRLGGDLLVFLVLPSGTTLIVQNDNGQYFRGTVSTGLILKDGEVIPSVPKIPGELVFKLLLPSAREPNQPVRLSADKYSVGSQLLREHIISVSMPRYPAQPKDSDGILAIQMEIDGAGLVRNVQLLQGDPALLPNVERAVREWRFRPFLIDTEAVTVTAPVVFGFRNGKVTSSVMR